MDTLEAMRIFTRVVEQGGFTAAARHLGISTMLASKYVRQLEDRIDARLLNRTTRRVSVTELGQIYYDRALTILEQMDELQSLVSEQTGSIRGHLRVTAPRVLGEGIVVDCANDFLKQHPEITIDLSLEERTVDIVQEGIDVAIRLGNLNDSSLIARKIARYKYLLCASPSYLEARGTPTHPDQLKAHDCIVGSTISQTNQWEFIVSGQKVLQTIKPRARVNAAEAIRKMALENHGIGMCLISTVQDDLANGRLVRVLQEFEAYDRNAYVIYPHRRHLAPRVKAFADHVALYFRNSDQVEH
ncbi:LysR family transcriptional regulator [Kiloniella laminariae]|uniref:LysR family transcriptional regulator n=1 Tax=Kiloniella laminariae TaxID=454162 RepID=A0ABT4LM16_9PROT|nr:LysR family transcriptional regulator [Kiloniella laminariae]MCZ4281007.1 LysR family transcriptional regulator [Kiloniella laminariae]